MKFSVAMQTNKDGTFRQMIISELKSHLSKSLKGVLLDAEIPCLKFLAISGTAFLSMHPVHTDSR